MRSIIFKSSLTWHVVHIFSLFELKFIFIINNNFTFINLGFHLPQIPSVHSGAEAALTRALAVGKEIIKSALIRVKVLVNPRLDVISKLCWLPVYRCI